ncbi:MAG TPA: phosphonate ABC transporter ATP-binding protein [Beijerinckiaceae bacterium]|nr:phosphonate ABC transporter ATP-binding protein [Beijerinckiaceae bacterium]
MIEVEGLAKSYGGRKVLNDVSLSVQAGEFVVVLGPSGAGKSTLLRCINGLVQPDGGRVAVDGREVAVRDTGRREGVRPIAMVFQHHNLVRRLSVLKNVLVGRMATTPSLLALCQLFRKADVDLAFEALREVELEHKAYMRADRLSGGEQQRVGIARVLAQKPAVILADEPVASLDPKTSRVVLGFLKRVCKDHGIAVICNLHQVEYALEFGERIVGLSGGSIIFDGPPDRLTIDIVHRIYPGLEDPGIARILRPRRERDDEAWPTARRASA